MNLRVTSLASKQEYAYEAIKEMIVSNEFLPGDLLVERTLSTRLDISRTPIRAALTQLANEGLVTFHPGRGMAVASFDLSDALDIFELREALDVLAIKLFMNNVTKNLLAEMLGCINDMEAAYHRDDFKAGAAADIKFHSLYLNNTKNRRLQPFLGTLMDQINRLLNSVREDSNHAFVSLREHREIYEAVAKDDVQEAQHAMLRHIISLKEYHLSRIIEESIRNKPSDE